MTFAEFIDRESAAGLSPALAALWHERRGDWTAAHEAAQADGGRDAAWVHAYLHRVEGDEGNAGYWYARTGRKAPGRAVSLTVERDEITRALLGGGGE